MAGAGSSVPASLVFPFAGSPISLVRTVLFSLTCKEVSNAKEISYENVDGGDDRLRFAGFRRFPGSGERALLEPND